MARVGLLGLEILTTSQFNCEHIRLSSGLLYVNNSQTLCAIVSVEMTTN